MPTGFAILLPLLADRFMTPRILAIGGALADRLAGMRSGAIDRAVTKQRVTLDEALRHKGAVLEMADGLTVALEDDWDVVLHFRAPNLDAIVHLTDFDAGWWKGAQDLSEWAPDRTGRYVRDQSGQHDLAA